MRNHEVTSYQRLLNSHGFISEEGWARHPVWQYDRRSIKASSLKIKEWDYYAVHNTVEKWTVCATISDLGYAGLVSISFIDYWDRAYRQTEEIKLLTLGKMGLLPGSEQDGQTVFTNERIRLCFVKNGNLRILMLGSVKLDLDARFEIECPEDAQSINIATSWAENRKAFYLNEKKNCMRVSGKFRMGEKEYSVNPLNTFAVLDWGRGRWTRENTWYWASLSSSVGSDLFGFNLGYGFTDRSPASENALFFNNKIHKLDDVEFVIDDDYMKPWIIRSSDGRFESVFTPCVDRCSDIKNIFAHSVQHQVFGSFNGKAVLDDGSEIVMNDLTGFAEKVYNKW